MNKQKKEKYFYTDEDGIVLYAATPIEPESCPFCGSAELKCKGSFYKCLNCLERFESCVRLEVVQEPKAPEREE